MSLKEISEAAVRYSDNTAGNLLLQQLGLKVLKSH